MIIAGNFKANLNREEVSNYCSKLDEVCKNNTNEVYIFPSATSLIENKFSFQIGVQNAYPCTSGAFTGEITLDNLNDFNIKSIIIGHSERRMLKEDDMLLSLKFNFYKYYNFKIFYCIGEDASVRKAGETLAFLNEQLKTVDISYDNLIVAYEPLWAIGKQAATKEIIEEVFSYLKGLGIRQAIYGGSVSEENSGDIMSIPGVDGVLVGKNSLDVERFTQIIESAH